MCPLNFCFRYSEYKNLWFGQKENEEIGFFRKDFVEELLEESVTGNVSDVVFSFVFNSWLFGECMVFSLHSLTCLVFSAFVYLSNLREYLC